jgi:hypothetical protein
MNKYNLKFGSRIRYESRYKHYSLEEKEQTKNRMKSNNDIW